MIQRTRMKNNPKEIRALLFACIRGEYFGNPSPRTHYQNFCNRIIRDSVNVNQTGLKHFLERLTKRVNKNLSMLVQCLVAEQIRDQTVPFQYTTKDGKHIKVTPASVAREVLSRIPTQHLQKKIKDGGETYRGSKLPSLEKCLESWTKST